MTFLILIDRKIKWIQALRSRYVRLGINSEAHIQSLINQTGKGMRARFNVLGLLALKFISRWECGLNQITASYQRPKRGSQNSKVSPY